MTPNEMITYGFGLCSAIGAIIMRDRHIFKTIADCKDKSSTSLSDIVDRHNDATSDLKDRLDESESSLYKVMSNNKDKFTDEVMSINDKMVHKDDFLEANRQMRDSIGQLSKANLEERRDTQLLLANILSEVKK